MSDLNKVIRLADIVPESVVDGKGIRMTVFVQGCTHHCRGCHNPTTWNKEGGKEYTLDFITDLAERDPLLDGMTFSGGEPFEQPEPLAALARWCHEHSLNVWCYSGYTYEQLCEAGEKNEFVKELLAETDVLVDGRFEESKKDLMLVFRGSSNQRVIDMTATRKSGEIVLLLK